MTFHDIFKKSFLENFTVSDITALTVVEVLGVCAVLSLIILGIYYLKSRKAFFSKDFAVSLLALSMITAAIILTIQSSVVVSLGMVGALSIVRFRTAVKNPLDLVFLFWSISVGIICGAGLFYIAVVMTLLVGAVLLLIDEVPGVRQNEILTLHAAYPCDESKITEIVKKYAPFYQVKSRSIEGDAIDMIFEVRLPKKNESECLKKLHGVKAVTYVSLISQEGNSI